MLMVPKGGPTARYCLGVVHYAKGEFSEAEESWREAIKLKPTMARAHNNLGILHLLEGKPRLALASFRDAVRHEPENANYRLNLAWGLEGSKLDQLALDELIKVEKLARENNNGSIGFAAKAMRAYIQGSYQKTQKMARAALQTNPKFLHALMLEARAYEKLNNKEKAKELYEEVLKIDSHVVEAKKALERL